MVDRRITPEMTAKALQIIAGRESERPIMKVLQALSAGLDPDPQDAAVLIQSLFCALLEPDGRKLLGMKPFARGKSARYDVMNYSHDSPAGDVARRFSQGALTRAQARQELAEHVGSANIKTLDRMLTDLCAWLAYPLPD